MARARNIKPGLFTNEVLVDLPAFDRLLFIGLWCLADREGRLEDRVKRIKMELFPCDNYDIDAGLNNLAGAGFISRYSYDGHSIVEVVNFTKHQSPHATEKDSDLPDINGYLTVYERNGKLAVKGSDRKIHVKERSNTVTAPLEPVTAPLGNALIPDSGFTDSLIPEEDQHHPLSANEETQPAGPEKKPTPEKSSAVGGNPTEAKIALVQPDPEPTPQPVDPKSPVEMTLDWEPDANLLKTYCVHFGVSADLLTKDSIAAFTAHHETEGSLNTQAKWVSLMVRWARDDKTRASNVRQFPSRLRGEEAFDDDDTEWINQEFAQ